MPAEVIQQGEERIVAFGDLTYCLHHVETSPEGFRVALSVRRGSETLGLDTIPLSSSRRRKEFAGTFSDGLQGQIERNLLDIDLALREDDQARRRRAAEAQAKAEAGAEMPEEERKDALELLCDPRLLLRIEDDLGSIGIVGEDRVKVITYLIATSRKQPVGQGLAATFKANSSSGKSWIVRGVSDLMPPEEVQEFTHLSPKALFYMGENGIAHKLVVSTEVAGREEAEYSVRTLISEPFITSGIPVKDEETGRFSTETFKVNGPIAYLETTTKTQINAENSTRVFELYLDEDQDQTRTIIKQQAREAGRERFTIEARRDRIRRIHQNAQRLLRSDLHVIIPFAEKLTFPSKDRRARRDFSKLLNLIRVITFLHQYQREIQEQGDRRFIEATQADYTLAYELACPTFKETLDTLDRRDRKVLEIIFKNVKEAAGPDRVTSVQFDRAKVSQWTGRHRNHLVATLNRLEDAEYLSRVEGGTGKRIVYQVNEATIAEDTQTGFEGLTLPEEILTLRPVLEAV